MRWLVVDNHDSYTHNLVQLLAVVTGSEPDVVSDADVTPGELDLTPYAGIIVSPGPGHPSRARDFARAADVLARSEVPVLGVCLGMQGIALAAGALVDAAPRPRHGHVETVRHTGDALFAGVPEFFPATRYHSFRVAEPLPPQLEPIAWAADGVLMGVRHRTRPQVGVQFHPESIASGYGRRVIENFVVQCGGRREDRAPARERVRGAGAARVLTRVLDVAVDAEAAFSALHATSRSAFWFDSTSRGAGSGRFSFLGEGSRVLPDGAGVLARLEAELRVRDVEGSAELPFDFAGGVVGWAGYELRAECGFPTGRVDDAPVARWLVCERFVAIDHDTGRTWLVARVDDDGEQMRAREWLRRCGSVLIGLTPPAPPRPVGAVRRVGLRPGYRAAVEAAQRALAAGESYEVCLTTEVRVAADDVGDGEPFEVYRRLRRANPAPYGAYLR
ncbi:MAG: glutamine amidotransferase-related protein, partial [Janthinobacterium lividum]